MVLRKMRKKEEQHEHREIERRLDEQEDVVKEHERRLRDLEREAGLFRPRRAT